LTLRNLVSSTNTRAIKLLDRWGFTVSKDEQEINGHLFRAFEREPA
jgi:ribosomal protein S18 acetylase RimI-like enzyme